MLRSSRSGVVACKKCFTGCNSVKKQYKNVVSCAVRSAKQSIGITSYVISPKSSGVCTGTQPAMHRHSRGELVSQVSETNSIVCMALHSYLPMIPAAMSILCQPVNLHHMPTCSPPSI